MTGLPTAPRHPERICWGCDKFCPAREMACGNGSTRTPHPVELFGEGWLSWARENGVSVDPDAKADASAKE